MAWEAFGGGEGLAPPPQTLAPGRYAVSLRRTFDLSDRRPGERVRLRLPLPIVDAGLSDLEIGLDPAPDLAAPPAIGPARLDAIVLAPPEGETSLGVRLSFTARAYVPTRSAAALDPAEAELYTRPSEGLIKVSPRVRALGERLAGDAGDTWTAMRRFWRFMMDELSCGAIHYAEFDPTCPVDWVLEHGWYDCRVGSALLAALCRARGTPARLVSGYQLYVEAPSAHTWLEVWIDGWGWVPFDLLGWDLSAGGRDEDWRDYFFGQLDHRMAVERPPRLFNGAGSVRLPSAWHMLVAPMARGVSIELRGVDDDALVWRDEVEVQRLG
jgi:hypothetical protein